MSGNTYLNFFELMKYFNNDSRILIDLSLTTKPSNKYNKIIILYDTSNNKKCNRYRQ